MRERAAIRVAADIGSRESVSRSGQANWRRDSTERRRICRVRQVCVRRYARARMQSLQPHSGRCLALAPHCLIHLRRCFPQLQQRCAGGIGDAIAQIQRAQPMQREETHRSRQWHRAHAENGCLAVCAFFALAEILFCGRAVNSFFICCNTRIAACPQRE